MIVGFKTSVILRPLSMWENISFESGCKNIHDSISIGLGSYILMKRTHAHVL